MAKQTFTTGQVLTAAQQNSLQANDFNQTVSVKTANYSLLAADKGTRIEFNTSGSVTCTVNSGEFDAGDTLIIQNRGAGTATITAGTATVNTSASLALSQYSAGTLYFVSDSAALFFGDAAGISASLIDAKGDLIVGTADNTVGRLAVGTDGHTLVADSSTATGLAYAAPAAATFVGCRAFSTSTQTLTTGVETAITLNNETFDTDGFHDNSVNNTRLTVPSGKGGYYQITGLLSYAANSSGERNFSIRLNGTTIIANAMISGQGSTVIGQNISDIRNLSAGDYIELIGQQDGAATLNTFSGSIRVFLALALIGV